MNTILNNKLEQQLNKIVKQGYECIRLEYWRDWHNWSDGVGVWQLLIWANGKMHEFKADSPTEAVDKAFLWISKKEIIKA